MRITRTGLALLAMLSVVLACRQPVSQEPADTAGHDKAHWSYEGLGGPEHWAGLENEFAVCGDGMEQSPIDLAEAELQELPEELGFDYRPFPLRVENNGHTIQVTAENSQVSFAGDSMPLVQLHFHSASEHTVEGEQYPLEMHLVHASEDGRLAVVGVFFEEGDESPGLLPIWSHLPEQPGPVVAFEDVEIDPSMLLPETRTSWRYRGSLTTPPCSENVSWTVFTQPLTASREQLDTFRAIYSGTYRPTQPLNERVVRTDHE